jgi:hypothetical protein
MSCDPIAPSTYYSIGFMVVWMVLGAMFLVAVYVAYRWARAQMTRDVRDMGMYDMVREVDIPPPEDKDAPPDSTFTVHTWQWPSDATLIDWKKWEMEDGDDE